MFKPLPHRFASRWLKASCLALAMFAPVGVFAEDAKPTWKINMKEAEIRQLIEQVSDITGDSFVVDPRVKGKVTVVSNTEMTEKEILEMFESVLRVHNFASIRTGKMVKVVPTQGAKQDNVPVERADSSSDKIITQVIPVSFSSATELVPILRPMVPQYGHLAAVTSANALIISDHSVNVQRILDIVKRIDTAENEESDIIQLKHAWVGDLVKLLEQLAGGAGGKAGGAGGGGSSRVKAVADERTNRLILRGEKSARQKLKALVADLDRPAEHSMSTQVIYLRFADAVQVSEVLRGILTGQATTPSSTSQGGFGAQGTSRSSGSSGFGSSAGGLGMSSSMGMGSTGGSSTGGTRQRQGAAAAVQAGNITIQADDTLNALVVRASPTEMSEVRSLIKQLDIRRAQVLIEAAIVEITGDAGKSLGVQWAAVDENVAVGGSNFDNVGNSISGILQAALASGGSSDSTSNSTPDLPSLANGLTLAGGSSDSEGNPDFALILQAINTASNTNVLSTPSIMTLDNEEAEILVGQNVPFITGSQLSSSGTNPFQTVERKDVGLSLKVTPQVNEGDTIRLRVTQEASNIATSATKESTDLITNKRLINTSIIATDGQVIVLGGLMEDTINDRVQKVPLLGDIPLLGALFRSTSKEQQKRNLLLFLRPTIVRDDAMSASVTNRKYNQVRSQGVNVDNVGEIDIDTNALMNASPGDYLDRGIDMPVKTED